MTAYDVRISDWSSDVGSVDLATGSASGASGGDDHLAGGPALGEVVDGVHRPVERVRRRHVWNEPALGQPPEQLGDVGRIALRLPPREGPPEDTDHRAALQQREVERDLRDVAGGETDHEAAAIPGHGPQRRLAQITADGVVADIAAPAVGELLHASLEVLGRVVDGLRGAPGAAQLELVVGGRRG